MFHHCLRGRLRAGCHQLFNHNTVVCPATALSLMKLSSLDETVQLVVECLLTVDATSIPDSPRPTPQPRMVAREWLVLSCPTTADIVLFCACKRFSSCVTWFFSDRARDSM